MSQDAPIFRGTRCAPWAAPCAPWAALCAPWAAPCADVALWLEVWAWNCGKKIKDPLYEAPTALSGRPHVPTLVHSWHASESMHARPTGSVGCPPAGFALPIDVVARVVPQLIQNGRVVRASLNAQVRCVRAMCGTAGACGGRGIVRECLRLLRWRSEVSWCCSESVGLSGNACVCCDGADVVWRGKAAWAPPHPSFLRFVKKPPSS
eukprot:357074-Chlamydomonas_euryale.AAC.1